MSETVNIMEEKKAPEESPTPEAWPADAPTTVLTQPGALPPAYQQSSAAVPQPKSFYIEKLAPHSFLALAICAAIVCGFFHIPSLACTIPALVLSCISRNYAKEGKFHESKISGNASMILSVVAILAGFTVNFVGLMFGAWIIAYVSECGLSGPCPRK